MAVLTVQTVLAISPDYLKSGRTYDQERTYIQWNGSVSYVSLYHRDNTSLPASEGGVNCNNGCTETVTRIQNGGSVSGNFTFLKTFNVQVAYTGDSSVGKAIIRACGTVIATVDLYTPGSGAPGFNNFPSPAWNVPTSGDCTWSITASGGYVDFRAVTTSYRDSPPPTVDLKSIILRDLYHKQHRVDTPLVGPVPMLLRALLPETGVERSPYPAHKDIAILQRHIYLYPDLHEPNRFCIRQCHRLRVCPAFSGCKGQ
jgi:hypothetical protein